MYGIYIIAIAFAVGATICGIPTLILWALLKKYRKERDRIPFYERRYDAEAEKDHEKYAKKAGTTYRWALAFLIVFAVCAFLAVSFAGGGAITLKGAEREYEQFLATQDVFEQVYVAENEFENIKLTETIIEMNHWMVRAKACKKTYGCFSQYYFLNVEDLEPIGKR
jgi:ABC-type maltose transport system permease subunit